MFSQANYMYKAKCTDIMINLILLQPTFLYTVFHSFLLLVAPYQGYQPHAASWSFKTWRDQQVPTQANLTWLNPAKSLCSNQHSSRQFKGEKMSQLQQGTIRKKGALTYFVNKMAVLSPSCNSSSGSLPYHRATCTRNYQRQDL